MNNCSICGWGVAWCVDKEDKGTYWLCGRCAVEDVTEFIVKERLLVRVAEIANQLMFHIKRGEYCGSEKHLLEDALKELPEGMLPEVMPD